MTYPAPKQSEDCSCHGSGWCPACRRDVVAALRAENERLAADLKRAGSAGTLGKRIAALSEENTSLRAQVETLTGLCGEVEQWLRLKPNKDARIFFVGWMKRLRLLKGQR